MRVLIGYDGSGCSQAAIEDLKQAGMPDGTEASVITVADLLPQLLASVEGGSKAPEEGYIPPVVQKARALAATAFAEAKELAARGADLIRERFPTWKVDSRARGGSPYWDLIMEADKWRPDLVVIGSRGRGAMGRVFLGSVSQNVLSHAICSVRVGRIANAARGADSPVRLVVGMDGSTDSASALSAVAKRAWPKGTEARVVTAVDLRIAMALVADGFGPQVSKSELEGDPIGNGRAWAEHMVKKASDALGAAGINASPIVQDGDPKHILVDEAERWEADCVFVGAKGGPTHIPWALDDISHAAASKESGLT